jgi:thiosulfate/3-mercaptopyruvate sulfurtransferase
VEPLAPHEKIFVDTDILEDENHGDIACDDCHGGDPEDPDWKTAHDDVVKDPTYPDATEVCGDCHDEINENYTKSLHVSLKPFTLIIDKRASRDKTVHSKIELAKKEQCFYCHSSCGQCHISRPDSVEGGFLDGHLYLKKPPMEEVCTACHGSRIKGEYFGENKGVLPDVHRERHMKCEKCHTGQEMHGDGKDYASRYAVENRPGCIDDCHKGIYTREAKNVITHRIHKDKASCYVCHAQPYKNCSSCHVGKDKDGLTFYKTKASWLDFKIGLNPLGTGKGSKKFVTLRHVPVDRGTFDFYVKDALNNFDSLPTWKFATPHNIRRKTPQNSSCNACHGNEPLFLLEKDVEDKEKAANKAVIVPVKLIPRKQKWQPR